MQGQVVLQPATWLGRASGVNEAGGFPGGLFVRKATKLRRASVSLLNHYH